MREMADENDRSDAWLLQVSLKTNGQSLINVRSMDKDGLENGLLDIIELADKIAEAETAVGAVQMVKTAMPGSQVQGPPPSVGGGQQASAVAPQCDCGLPAKFVPGGVSNSTQRPYKAFWACSKPRGQQCRFRSDA